MGTEKAMLRIGGEALWRRQLNLLAKLSPERLWISARTAPAWCPAGVEVVLDLPPARGPLSGICACLERLPTTHLVVLGIDLPRMDLDHLMRLMKLVCPDRSVLPRNGDYFEPLCAIYAQSAAPLASEVMATGDGSLQSLARQLVDQNLAIAYPLPANERPLYLNLNTPDDLNLL